MTGGSRQTLVKNGLFCTTVVPYVKVVVRAVMLHLPHVIPQVMPPATLLCKGCLELRVLHTHTQVQFDMCIKKDAVWYLCIFKSPILKTLDENFFSLPLRQTDR